MASVDKRKNGKYLARWREYPGGPQKTRTFDKKGDADKFLVGLQHDQTYATTTPPCCSAGVSPASSALTRTEYWHALN